MINLLQLLDFNDMTPGDLARGMRHGAEISAATAAIATAAGIDPAIVAAQVLALDAERDVTKWWLLLVPLGASIRKRPRDSWFR